jgi:3-hydroxyacyl-[acyl-carrier-protein] dehydratase
MTSLSHSDILDLVPQRAPFRFIDEILELDEEHIVACYTFRPDESFYAGHFPGNPITPGVILLETMAQTGVVAFGIYLVSQQMPVEQIRKTLTVFTDAEVEFSGMVRPGEKVIIRAKKRYFRRMKLKVDAEIESEQGTVVCSGSISGMGVDNG